MVDPAHNSNTLPNPSEYGECPKCHQHALVHYGDSIYVCLNCDFRKDVSKVGPSKEKESAGTFNVFIAILIAIALAALMF